MLLIALFGILIIANLAGMLVTESHIIILDKYVIDTNKKTDGTLLLELPDGLREVTYEEEKTHFYIFKDSNNNYYNVPSLKTKSRAVAKVAPNWRAYKYLIKYTTSDKTPIIVGKVLSKENDTDYNSALELVAKNEKEVHNKVVNHFVWFLINLILWYILSRLDVDIGYRTKRKRLNV